MAIKRISKSSRKPIIKAFSAARQHGYFAKLFSCSDRDTAIRAMDSEGNPALYVYALDTDPSEGIMRMYWSGDGALLTELLKAHGLQAEWDGTAMGSIAVRLRPGA
jgi:hypothetical protein